MAIRFHARWQAFHQQRYGVTGPIDERLAAEFRTIQQATLQNTVLNVSNGKEHVASSYRRARLGCDALPLPSSLAPPHQLVHLANCTPRFSPFKHKCYKNNRFPGKILHFKKNGIIVAGKASPSDVLFRAVCFMRSQKLPFFQALAYPNSVSSGGFKYKLNRSLKRSPKVVSSSKFPGSAVILEKKHIQCTPEFYDGFNKGREQKPSKFILPGKMTVAELFDVLKECDALAMAHSNLSS